MEGLSLRTRAPQKARPPLYWNWALVGGEGEGVETGLTQGIVKNVLVTEVEHSSRSELWNPLGRENDNCFFFSFKHVLRLFYGSWYWGSGITSKTK